jgi:hypothetical protein
MHEYVHTCVYIYIYVCAKDMYVYSFRVVKKTLPRKVWWSHVPGFWPRLIWIERECTHSTLLNHEECIFVFHISLWVHHHNNRLIVELLLNELDTCYCRNVLHYVPWHLRPQYLKLLL